MAIQRTYLCPSCAGKFNFLHHPSDEPPPRFCPLCGYDTAAPDVTEFAAAIVAPHVQKRVVVQAVEQTYRGMEAASASQIDQAVAMTGLDRSEFDNMKVTNLRDDMREGDIASVPVNNDVSRMMAAAPGLTGFQNPNAIGMAAAAHTGVGAHAGAKTAAALRQHHAAAGHAMHEAPTVETLRRGSGTSF